MIYFISGHRDITADEFNNIYVNAINEALRKEADAKFVVGDYEGVDILAQQYLKTVIKDPKNVTVYYMFDKPRNFAYNVHDTIRFGLIGGFKTDEERDAAMTSISDIDIAFVRKGKWSSGTAQNIKRRHTLKNI